MPFAFVIVQNVNRQSWIIRRVSCYVYLPNLQVNDC